MTTEAETEDQRNDPAEPITEDALRRTGAFLTRLALVAPETAPDAAGGALRQELLDVANWLSGARGDPGSAFPVRAFLAAAPPQDTVLHPVQAPDLTDVKKAVEWMRIVVGCRRASVTISYGYMALILAECDRRGEVEAAAAAFILAGLCGNPDTSAELTALIAAVRTNRSFDA